MARKPKRSHRAYKEWAPSVRQLEQNIIIITHGKINGRATVNLKINILDSRTNHSVLLVRDKRFLLEDTSKMTKFFFYHFTFFSFFWWEIITRWLGYFYWRRLSPFRFSRTYCKICKITCFYRRHSLPANPPKWNLVPVVTLVIKKWSLWRQIESWISTLNSRRDVCSRRQSSCRTNKNMKNNM